MTLLTKIGLIRCKSLIRMNIYVSAKHSNSAFTASFFEGGGDGCWQFTLTKFWMATTFFFFWMDETQQKYQEHI